MPNTQKNCSGWDSCPNHDHRNRIIERPLHLTLWCVYAHDGELLGAFPSVEAAEAFSANQMYGPEL